MERAGRHGPDTPSTGTRPGGPGEQTHSRTGPEAGVEPWSCTFGSCVIRRFPSSVMSPHFNPGLTYHSLQLCDVPEQGLLCLPCRTPRPSHTQDPQVEGPHTRRSDPCPRQVRTKGESARG